MNKFLIRITLLLVCFSLLYFCASCSNFNDNDEKINVIPQNNISYTHLEFGNVVDEGKQAVFFNFSSDFIVIKMEINGVLLDKSGDTIYSFDTALTFSSPSINPKFPIRIDANLIKNVNSAAFTKIKAYTTQEVNFR